MAEQERLSMFNPQAVLFCSAPEYTAHCEMTPGRTIELQATLQFNGNYYLESSGYFEDIAKADSILQALGIPKLYRRSQGSQYEVLRIMAALGSKVTQTTRDGPAHQAFLQTQVDNATLAQPPLTFVQGRQDFIRIARPLLEQYQADAFAGFSIRELVNPLQCVAVSKQRTGLFLWPDWEDPRYVNAVLGCTKEQLHRLREPLHDWAAQHGLRLNVGTQF